MMRVAIAGGPFTGKTTLATRMGQENRITPRSTDDLIDLGWSDASEAASRWFDDPGPLIVEGVAVLRALRKWLARNPTGAPVAVLIMLRRTWGVLTPGQARMARGVETVLGEVYEELRARGVTMENRS